MTARKPLLGCRREDQLLRDGLALVGELLPQGQMQGIEGGRLTFHNAFFSNAMSAASSSRVAKKARSDCAARTRKRRQATQVTRAKTATTATVAGTR